MQWPSKHRREFVRYVRYGRLVIRRRIVFDSVCSWNFTETEVPHTDPAWAVGQQMPEGQPFKIVSGKEK